MHSRRPGVKPVDVQVVSIYDSFTITVSSAGGPRLLGKGEAAVRRGRQPDLRHGEAAFNTDGGGSATIIPPTAAAMTR